MMKKRIILFISWLLLLTPIMQATDYKNKTEHAIKNNVDNPCECEYQYAKDRKYVYFNGKRVEGADAETFTVLKNEHAKDRKIVENNTDYPCEDQYAKDKYRGYINGIKIEGSDGKSFEIFKDGYSKDEKYVYYKGIAIKDGVSNFWYTTDGFEVLGNGYAKDNRHAYYKGIVLKDVDGKSFQVLPSKNLK